MTEPAGAPAGTPGPAPPAEPARRRAPPPAGYRQGLITAITVLLGFSLSFLRFWGFEAAGAWTVRSTLAAITVVGAVLLQVFALGRALRPEDDEEHEYRITVRWLLASALVLLAGLSLALLIDSGAWGGR